MKRYLASVCVAMTTVTAVESSAEAATITEIVVQSGGEFDNNKSDYDILLNAVLAADLAGALDDPEANLTVFAPNDRAFIRLAQDLGYEGNSESAAWNFLVEALTDLGNGDPIPVLTAVLLYHVAPEELTPFDLFVSSIFQTPVETLQGGSFQPFFLKLIDNDPDFKNPRLTLPLNIQADNGRIHTIDRVLIPLDLP